jgi:hypothetical protein
MVTGSVMASPTKEMTRRRPVIDLPGAICSTRPPLSTTTRSASPSPRPDHATKTVSIRLLVNARQRRRSQHARVQRAKGLVEQQDARLDGEARASAIAVADRRKLRGIAAASPLLHELEKLRARLDRRARTRAAATFKP